MNTFQPDLDVEDICFFIELIEECKICLLFVLFPKHSSHRVFIYFQPAHLSKKTVSTAASEGPGEGKHG